jgi:hypothetical protein
LYIGITSVDVKGKMVVAFELQVRSGRHSLPFAPQSMIEPMPIYDSVVLIDCQDRDF